MPLAAAAREQEMLRFFERYGIRPRHVIGHTQYFDVMAAMLERGVGISSIADCILPPEMRDTVVMLYPLENWRLLWYRKDHGTIRAERKPPSSFSPACCRTGTIAPFPCRRGICRADLSRVAEPARSRALAGCAARQP